MSIGTPHNLYDLYSPDFTRVVGEVRPPEAGWYCDLLVACLGYEPRCTFAAERLCSAGSVSEIFVLAYPDEGLDSYAENRAAFESIGAERPEIVQDDEVFGRVRERLSQLPAAREPIVIGLDVSSFSRLRTSLVIEAAAELAERRPVSLHLLYSPPAFLPPSPDDGPLSVLQPVSALFTGFAADPEFPTAVIVGLGYEEERALGVVERLEASLVWLFVPRGNDPAYDSKVLENNAALLKGFGPRVIEYNPAAPLEAFRALQSLAHGLRSEYRVLMAPMGPKILSACALMLSIISAGEYAVWRASAGEVADPRISRAAGDLVGLAFDMGLHDKS